MSSSLLRLPGPHTHSASTGGLPPVRSFARYCHSSLCSPQLSCCCQFIYPSADQAGSLGGLPPVDMIGSLYYLRIDSRSGSGAIAYSVQVAAATAPFFLAAVKGEDRALYVRNMRALGLRVEDVLSNVGAA